MRSETVRVFGRRDAVALIALFALATPRAGQAQSADSAAVVAAVEGFHSALASGDSTAALALLADDVLIVEGRVETKTAYRSGHLRGDMAFARAVKSQRTVANVRVDGDAAWVVSTSVTQGEYNGRAVNSAGTELMVLSRSGGKWKIRAVHWASRERRPPG